MNNTALALDSLLTRYENLFKTLNPYHLPTMLFDESWHSACIQSVDGDTYFWKHVAKQTDNCFDGIERALERTFHQDIHTFYSSFWSNGIRVEHPVVDFALIQVWNEEDLERLKENILGHCFAKMKAKLPLTVFIGSTDNNEVVCIDNESGNVVLERPGRKAHKILADNLESFLLALDPTTKLY